MPARSPILWLVIACLLFAGCGGSSSSSTSSGTASTSPSGAPTATSGSSTMLGFEGMPLEQGSDLAPASSTQTGPVDGIQCGPTEQLVYHIHAHLAVYANGSPRALPAGIGIPGSVAQQTPQGPVAGGGVCIYWLHTHTSDGVIHVESPSQRVYTLGDFFDEWHQPLRATQVGLASGRVTAWVNGKRWTNDLRTIPLVPHAVIQLSVGAPVKPFQSVSWSQTQL